MAGVGQGRTTVEAGFSRKSSKYNERRTRARWQSYHRSPPDRIGFGSLHHAATRADPEWQNRLDQQLIETQARANAEALSRANIAAQRGRLQDDANTGTLSASEEPDSAAVHGAATQAMHAYEAPDGAIFSGEVSGTVLHTNEAPDTAAFKGTVVVVLTKSGLVVVRLADVPAEKVNWFWKERIARGMLSVFAGMADVNKSTAFLDLAARATHGGRLPAGEEGQVPQGSVIILTAEDTLANTVRPRLEVAGADLTRIHVIKMVDAVVGQHPARSFDLTRDIRRLEILINEIGDVVLVGIDPISAYMGKPGKLDSHRETDIRSTLMPLSEMAERRNVAVVGINHLNKNSGTEAILRIVGSIAFVGGPRAAYFIVRDDENNDRRLFLPVKNNISKIRTGLAFRVIDKLAPPPVFDAYPAIKWEEQTITITADEALAARPDGRKSERLEAAKALIAEMLANEPQPATTIEERAAAQGITAKSLRNAKAGLFVRAAQAGRQWWWCLPGQEPPF